MDWIGLDWIRLDWIGLNWVDLDCMGWEWDWDGIGLDWIGLDCKGLDWIGLYNEQEDMILDILSLAHQYDFPELESSISDYLKVFLGTKNSP